jgi:plastocyanin
MVRLVALVLAAAPAQWLGDDLPLPLTVKSEQDLKFKAAAEKQYLMFNLMAAGKVAFDKGDYATAADRWETLLKLPELPASIDTAVRPLAVQAREKAGGQAAELPPPAPAETGGTPPASSGGASKRSTIVTLSGMVSGGGPAGPGGAVVYLKRVDGPTPRPKPGKARTVLQKDKRFEPRVLAVAVGTTVDFRNDDPLFHNVFSLSRPNDFDLGLYKGGTSKQETFNTAGAVQLLCNIHSSMMGYVYVVDTPWFAQADAAGKFTIHGVPTGEYLVQVWHENASKVSETKMRVTDPPTALSLNVDGDKGPPAFVPDKSGKPRQPQLGY